MKTRRLLSTVSVRRVFAWCAIATALSVWIQSPAAVAAAVYEVGDEVEVFYLNKWWPAKVLNTNKQGQVLAEFEFAGQPHREPFQKNQVRAAFESGALARARSWSDTTGKFRTKAALLAITSTEVTLRKPDMTELKVPIEKLSKPDQQFVKKFVKQLGSANVVTVPVPPLEEFAAVEHWAGVGPTERAAIAPDPEPDYLKLKEGGAGFPSKDFFDRLGAVIPVGGPEGWLLAGVENETPGGATGSRLLWCSLKSNKIEGSQLLPPGEIVLDYHAPSYRLLTQNSVKSDDPEQWTNYSSSLTLWEVQPKDKDAKAIVRWNAGEARTGNDIIWARLTGSNTVLQRSEKQQFVCWDVANKSARYRITQESFFAPDPTLSGGRKYLFLPEDSHIRIFDTETGNVVSVLPVTDGAAAVAVSPDGGRAAVLGRSTVTVWRLADAASAPDSYQAEAIGTPFTSTMSWVGNERLMVDQGAFGMVLYSLAQKLTLWNYQFDFSEIKDWRGKRLREVVNDHLVYSASVSGGSQTGFAVGAVRLPGPKVEEVAKALDPASLMVIKPGSRVRLAVNAGSDTPAVQAALEREIVANGWKITPDASTVVTAEMTRGPTQQVTYVPWNSFRKEDGVSASVTPYISSVRIDFGKEIAWQSGTRSGAPSRISLRQGESVQGEVDKWQKPDVQFFKDLDIPANILDPAKRLGLGVTTVTNRGLIAK